MWHFVDKEGMKDNYDHEIPTEAIELTPHLFLKLAKYSQIFEQLL